MTGPSCLGRDEELLCFFLEGDRLGFYFFFVQILSMFVSKPYESNCITWCESHFLPSSVAAPVVVSSEGLLPGLWCRGASSCTVLYTQRPLTPAGSPRAALAVLWGCLSSYKQTQHFTIHLWSHLNTVYLVLWALTAPYKYFSSTVGKSAVKTARWLSEGRATRLVWNPFSFWLKVVQVYFYFLFLFWWVSPVPSWPQHVFDSL